MVFISNRYFQARCGGFFHPLLMRQEASNFDGREYPQKASGKNRMPFVWELPKFIKTNDIYSFHFSPLYQQQPPVNGP